MVEISVSVIPFNDMRTSFDIIATRKRSVVSTNQIRQVIAAEAGNAP